MDAFHRTGTLARQGRPTPSGDDGFQEWQTGFCHDLREPAAAIVMLAATAVLEAGDPGTVQRRLRQITSEARWLTTLIDHSVDNDEHRALDLSGLVRECLERVGSLSLASMRAETPPAGPSVLGPQLGLRRAVTNVLTNAARAAGHDGEVVVRVHQHDGFALADVVDNGPGFGRMPTVHGVGLHVTEAVLKSVGGSLDVSSGPSGGTRVCLRMPLHGTRDAS